MKQYDNLLGRRFIADNSVEFTVVEVEPYPADRVKPPYRDILSMGEWCLVAVAHRGTLIPNITVKGGVARLTKVRVGEKLLERPGAISKAIGITRAMHPIGLAEIS